MSFPKQHALKIVMAALLLVSVALSVYSIRHVPAGSSSGGAHMPQQGFRQGGGFMPQGGQQGMRFSNHPGGMDSPGAGTGSEGGPSSANGSRRMPGPGGGSFGRSPESSSAYATGLAVFAAVFFGLTAAAFYKVAHTGRQIRETNKAALVWMLLGIGLFLRIAAAPWISGHPFDINLFKSWASSAANGLTGFYTNGSSDYPPFYVYVLYLVGKLASTAAMNSYFTLLIKLPSILADVATAYLLYRVASKRMSFEISLLIAAFYTFNPAVFINSTFWGQVDSFFTLLVVAALVLLSENKLGWSTALLTAAVLMKPQGIIYLPVLFFVLWRSKQLKAWLTAAASGIATVLLVVLPFSLNQSPSWLIKLYSSTVNEYPYASVNGYNFFALLGANYKKDSSTLFLFSYHTWGMVFIVLVALFAWRAYAKSRNPRFASAAALLLIAGVFTFSSGMHERYLFPAAGLALLAFIYLQDKRLLWLAGGFSLTIFLNTYDIFYSSAQNGAAYSVALFATSLLNVLLFGYLAKTVWGYGFRQKAEITAAQTA